MSAAVKSKMSDVVRSGFDLVPHRKVRRVASAAHYARVTWKPWKDVGESLIPDRETAQVLATNSRIAHAVMLRSKRQLMAGNKQLGEEKLDEVLASLFQTAENFKQLAHLVETAVTRMIAAEAARALAPRAEKRRSRTLAKAT